MVDRRRFPVWEQDCTVRSRVKMADKEKGKKGKGECTAVCIVHDLDCIAAAKTKVLAYVQASVRWLARGNRFPVKRRRDSRSNAVSTPKLHPMHSPLLYPATSFHPLFTRIPPFSSLFLFSSFFSVSFEVFTPFSKCSRSSASSFFKLSCLHRWCSEGSRFWKKRFLVPYETVEWKL